MATPGQQTTGRRLPWNQEAELSVLGGLLLDNQALHSVAEAVQAEDFYRESHQQIFAAMFALADRAEPIDLVTVAEALSREGQLEQVGGLAYLSELLAAVPTAANVVHYARIVHDKALIRRIIRAATDIAEEGYQEVPNVQEYLDRAEQRVFNAAGDRKREGVQPVKSLIKETFHRLEQLYSKDVDYTGVRSGFKDLDDITSGFQDQNLVIVAGRPGMGKTSFCLNLAVNAAARFKTPTAVFSLEMSSDELVQRMLSSEAMIDQSRMRTGRLEESDWTKLIAAAGKLSEAPLFIDDSAALSVMELRAKARRLASDHKLGLLIIDYLQLMKGSSGSGESREREISEISRSLKALAKELKIPVIALSQLNRGVERREDRKPKLADLRECVSGETEVMLADGRRSNIRDLVGTRPTVLAVTEDGTIAPEPADKVWRVGVRPVFDVVLASGRTVRVTADHRLLGAKGWTRTKEIVAGDRLAIARRVPCPGKTERWSDDRLILLAHLLGDGSYLPHQPLRYTTASEENSAAVADAARREFGATVNRHPGRGRWHQLVISGNGNRWHPAGTGLWLRELGIFGQRSHQKRVPAEVFRLSNEQVALFVKHLWATDGSIFVRVKGRGAHRVFLATCSRGLALDVAALLLRFGIVARIRTTIPKEGRPMYSVDVSGGEHQAQFLGSIGGFGPRRAKADELASALAASPSTTNDDTLPREIWDQVRKRMTGRGVTQRRMAVLRGTSYGGTSHFRFAPSRAVVAEYAELLEDPELRLAARSDLFWDRVVEVIPAGEEEVFDLTVPGPACWLADGIVSHNSGAIEQDADMVLFIDREEMYREDTENKGLAEIIIGKHRNGPTGTVQLRFFNRHTLFVNLEKEESPF